MRRLALPVVFVLVLVGIVLLSDRLGYIGRVDGGPLQVGGTTSTTSNFGKPGRWSTVLWAVQLDSGPVKVTGARPSRASPGLRVTPLRRNRLGSGSPGGPKRWPPRIGDRGLAVGQRLRDGQGVILGLKARRRGIYLLDGYVVDYDRGLRHYRREVDSTICVAVGRHECGISDVRLPGGDEPVADMGGASDYGWKLNPDDGPVTETFEAEVPGRPVRRQLRVTLTNRTDERVRLTGLGLDRDISGLRVRVTGPQELVLGPKGSRTVALEWSATGCSRAPTRTFEGISDLAARTGGRRTSVPLLVTYLVEGAGGRC